MSYMINIMYGDRAHMQRFRFDGGDMENQDAKFDEAVKAINKVYKENGRYKTSTEVINHFKKYGFYRIAL